MIELIGLLALCLAWHFACKEYEGMESHIIAVMRLSAWGPLWGLEWMDGESVPAFRRRILQKTEIKPPPTTKAGIEEMLHDRGIEKCNVVESGPASVDIFVDPENVEQAQNIADFEFAGYIEWTAKSFEEKS